MPRVARKSKMESAAMCPIFVAKVRCSLSLSAVDCLEKGIDFSKV